MWSFCCSNSDAVVRRQQWDGNDVDEQSLYRTVSAAHNWDLLCFFLLLPPPPPSPWCNHTFRVRSYFFSPIPTVCSVTVCWCWWWWCVILCSAFNRHTHTHTTHSVHGIHFCVQCDQIQSSTHSNFLQSILMIILARLLFKHFFFICAALCVVSAPTPAIIISLYFYRQPTNRWFRCVYLLSCGAVTVFNVLWKRANTVRYFFVSLLFNWWSSNWTRLFCYRVTLTRERTPKINNHSWPCIARALCLRVCASMWI